MAEVKFYLEKRKDKKTGKTVTTNVPILLFYSFNGDRLQHYTGYRIDADKWDDGLMEKDGKTVRVHPGKVKKNHADASEINRELTKLISKVNDIHERADVLGERLSAQYFRDRLSGKKLDAKNSDTIWKGYELYLKAIEVTHTKKSIKNVRDSFNVLKWFCEDRNWTLTFDSIDSFFWQEFFDWCYKVKKYNNNYTGTHVNKIKAFLNWCVDVKKISTNTEFRKQPKMEEEIELIHLYWSELLKFHKFKFKNEDSFSAQQLSDARDLYCMGSFTGLRYSDVVKLLEENNRPDAIGYRVQKTKKINFIPKNKYNQAIIDKHKGKHKPYLMPQLVTDIHSTLRAAMKQAGLTRMVQIVHYRGAERIEERKPLWDAATFHTSKKTFVMNFVEKGGSITTAMAITGNTSRKVFRRYYQVTDQFKAKEMARIYGKVA
jgi:hypothetical protein